jgi:hypothetical protein
MQRKSRFQLNIQIEDHFWNRMVILNINLDGHIGTNELFMNSAY